MKSKVTCPFCGGDIEVVSYSKTVRNNPDLPRVYIPRCTKCPATMGTTYTTETKALQAMQRRV